MKIVRPEGKSRERQLVMGGWGTGKTNAWLDIARNTDHYFYVFDTDMAVERMLEAESDDVRKRVEWVEPLGEEFPDEYTGQIKKWSKEVKAYQENNEDAVDCWCIVDMSNVVWDQVQDYYVRQVLGEDPTWLAVEARKDAKEKGKKSGGNPLGMEYSTINKLYRDFGNQLIRWPGHLFLATPADQVNFGETTPFKDDKEIIDQFGEYGWRPRGQKHTAHLVHTVIHLKGNDPDTWRAITVKDRGGREELKGDDLTSFARQYLVGIAGWEVKK